MSLPAGAALLAGLVVCPQTLTGRRPEAVWGSNPTLAAPTSYAWARDKFYLLRLTLEYRIRHERTLLAAKASRINRLNEVESPPYGASRVKGSRL